MTIFDALTLIGGLCLFLFGMNVMGQALERSAGNKLELMLGRLTTGKMTGFATGMGVTAVIQSSSATTVMVVGFVNSGLMTLRQAINVIMGANVGTTVTAWILSLGGISGDNIVLKLLKPMSFTPVLALIGIILYMFSKSNKKKDIGVILLGFAVLMFGMDIMTDSVSGLKEIPAFTRLFVAFENPILGVLAGALLTAVIQSSSASVGILQALAATGAVSYGAAIPIIMGQNIGTCVTAIISTIGANKNAKRAALVHLSFNIIGTVVWLTVFSIVNAIFSPAILGEAATLPGIAIVHSIFNVLCTLLLLPASALLEKLAYAIIPNAKTPDKVEELDERLLATPNVALERCHTLTVAMANDAVSALCDSIDSLYDYSEEKAEDIRRKEDVTDHYEDIIGTYLVKLSSRQIGDRVSDEAAKHLRLIGDFERISDHAVNIIESAEEMREKGIRFSESADEEMHVLMSSAKEILELSLRAFIDNDLSAARLVEPLEQVIDDLKEQMRARHILRLQRGDCSIGAGFVWSDILTNIERTADHCSNIAACVTDTAALNLSLHETVRTVREGDGDYETLYGEYTKKYALPNA